MITCKKCGLHKRPADYYSSKRNVCKKCQNKASREYAKENREKINTRNRWSAEKYRIERRKRLANSTEGFSWELYLEMEQRQNSLCAICKTESKTYLNIDHDHKTGKVRGLLCRFCNMGLGSFKDNPVFLSEASKYLS